MNISLELYKTFYYAAKNKSISKAADEMLLSQPAISKSIKFLEEQMNTTLFIRKRDGVEITKSGKTLYSKIKSAMELINSAEADVKAFTDVKTSIINIGATKMILKNFLIDYIKVFHKKYPSVQIQIHTNKTTELVKKANLGLVDIIFTDEDKISCSFKKEKIFDLHYAFVVGKDFQYLVNNEIKLDKLSELPLLVLRKENYNSSNVNSFIKKRKLKISPEMVLSSNSLIKDFAVAGMGVGIIIEEYVKNEINNGLLFKLNIKNDIKPRSLNMYYNNSYSNSDLNNFMNTIKKVKK